jgi:hypothetical protein
LIRGRIKGEDESSWDRVSLRIQLIGGRIKRRRREELRQGLFKDEADWGRIKKR